MSLHELCDVLQEGLAEGASDWHIRENQPISIRVSGNIRRLETIADPSFIQGLFEDISSHEQREVYHETGDADFAFSQANVGRFRVNVHRQRGRMSMALRHVKDRVPDIHELGLPPILLDLAEEKNGIIFVTGSTGAGKSTTLACMIEHLNTVRSSHIVTIEDPIEYDLEDKLSVIEQREVGVDTISFDSAVRHALRQDPDVIVVGELRSRDSFESTLAAAETGHLVMTTLHTTTAAQSIHRILDFYPFEERAAVRSNLAGNLRAISCQRLVPRADGAGVVPINEVLINTPTVSKMIVEDNLSKLHNAIAGGLEEGMQTFNHALLQLIRAGTVTEEVGYAFASNPEALKMNIQGIFLNEDSGIVSR